MADISQIKLPNGDVFDLVDESKSTATNWVNGSQAHSVRTTNSATEDSSYTIGLFAVTEGLQTKASGDASHAEGARTIASGDYSHAEGDSTTASQSYSHAEGNYTIASGISSHAEGKGSSTSFTIGSESYLPGAVGNYSHVEGQETRASESGAHAEGYQTVAEGASAHTEGNQTVASGVCAHAEGYQTVASQTDAHAEGYKTKAVASYSHAEGNSTTANGESAHAEGANTIAIGLSSHVEGDHTVAYHAYTHVFGQYNIVDSSGASPTVKGNYIEIVGNGATEATRSNARTLDWSGNEVLAGKLTVGAVGVNSMDVATVGQIPNVPSWAMAATKPTYTANEVGALPATTTIPSKTSELTNDSGFITSDSDEKLSVNGITNGQTYSVIMGQGNSMQAETRHWDGTGFTYYGNAGSTSTTGTARISLGNSIAMDMSGNKQGVLKIYGINSYAVELKATDIINTNKIIELPNKDGTIALTSDIPSVPSNIVNTITTTAGAHTAISSQKGNVSFNVPTKTSHLTNDSGFITVDNDYRVTQTNITTGTAYPVLFGYQVGAVTTTNQVYKSYPNFTFDPETGTLKAIALSASTFNSYRLNAASEKDVDTSIDINSTSINLPTSAAVASLISANIKPALVGDTSTITPTQVYEALQEGRDVVLTHNDADYGSVKAYHFNYSAALNAVVSSSLVSYFGWHGISLLGELGDNDSEGTWSLDTTALATMADIPTVTDEKVAIHSFTTGNLYFTGTSEAGTSSGTTLLYSNGFRLNKSNVNTYKLMIGSGSSNDLGQISLSRGIYNAIVRPSSSQNSDITLYLPNANGTIALTSDIPDVSGFITTDSDEKVRVSPTVATSSYYGMLHSLDDGNTSTKYYDLKIKYSFTNGTSESAGIACLTLGNDNNLLPDSIKGQIRLYAESQFVTIDPGIPVSGGATITLPSTSGILALASDIPTKTSDLTNDSGFLTSYTETDPTVPAWAKASTKPSYTASEVGAQPTLVSGTNIKTINNQSILGSGNIPATSIPTVDTIAEFDSAAHMNSTDMTTQEVSDFVDSLDAQGSNLADYIVEQGTSGIWTYRKWVSGIAECWGTESAKSYAITGGWTNGFYAQSTLVYPSGLFASVPVATLQKTGSGAGLEWMSIHTHSASQVSFYVCDTKSQTVSFPISAYAIGRWK